MLSLDKLAVGYAGNRVLDNVSQLVGCGSFICVLGRNGAGKTTLMRTIAGLQPALAGNVWLHAASVSRIAADLRARQIAVVLTERVSSPGLLVDDVVALARQPFTGWEGKTTAADQQAIAQAVQLLGIERHMGRLFDDLSDGERQRVSIARALAQTPQLMILDEITAFLDLPGRVEVMSLLRRIARTRNITVLLSSHDLELSLELADKLWLLDGSGGIVAGTPTEIITSGALNRTFDSGEVSFSAQQRRFILNSTNPAFAIV